MRLAVVSDIHGNLPALEAVVQDMKHRDIDAVVNLGDSVSGPLFPGETARLLRATKWFHLAGNHERQLLHSSPEQRGPSDAFARSQLTADDIGWLSTLRASASFNSDVFLCHATPYSDTEYFLETVEPHAVRAATLAEIDTRVSNVPQALLLCGHTHIPRVARSSRGQWIVNPGSVGLPAYHATLPHPHVMAVGSTKARYAVVATQGDGWATELIAVPYDHVSMAQLARDRNRDDWAAALESGTLT